MFIHVTKYRRQNSAFLPCIAMKMYLFDTGHLFGSQQLPTWHWWKAADAAHLCEVAFQQILQVNLFVCIWKGSLEK